jgi:methenyltetrahydromethanopterin cyclohydrolase
MSGSVQATGKTVENAMVKLLSLSYDVRMVKNALGVAPLLPLGSRTIVPDDMLSYASIVHLYVEPDEKTGLRDMAQKMPSQKSKDYGKSFTELTNEHRGLRGIDINLIAPAQIYVNDLKSGELYTYGKVNSELIKKMMGFQSRPNIR